MKISNSNYLTIVVISSILGNGEQVKAAGCKTDLPHKGPCQGLILSVAKGTACYYKKTFASISCSTGYTFTPGYEFTCSKHTWTSSSAAVCSSKVTTISATATTTITTTTVLTMSSTSKLYPSHSSSFSTVQNSASFHSTSTSTASSISKVSPSESNFVSTYSTVTSSETPYLKTYTTMSKTKMKTSRSYFQTKPSAETLSTSSSRQVVISSSMITTSSIMVPSDPSASDKATDSDINSAYIITPVVVCVLALVLGVAFLWWRRRTHKPAASFEIRGPGSLIANQIYGANGIDRHCSLINVRQSRVHEYAEIPLDIMNSDGTKGDNYETIDILPEDKADVKKSYDTFKLSETEFTDTNYSHIGLNNTQNNTHSNNTYSHTQLENVPQKHEITISGDDTYNKLNTTTLSNSRGKHIEDTDTEYNNAQAGEQDPEIEADSYSHLNTNIQTPGMFTTKMPHQQNEDNIKNRNIRQLSAKDLQSNTGYEFAKDFDNLKRSSEIKMPKQDDARKNKNSNNYAQDLTRNTGYEFAKDFDYLQNRSEAPEYANVTKKKPAVSKADNAGKDSETAVGTKHNYFVLEPEQNQAPTTALFNVVEDVSTETDEMPEAETGHEYFTLEKQDM